MMELLRLLLVDDEKIILKGLEETYDWASMGFTIAGTASDGIAALEMIETAKPDVVLTDIRMKRMGGLELMEKAQKIAPLVSFVVLSAYRDFEYAQTALRNRALAYLVKPINDEELKETMMSVYEACKDKIFKTESYEKWRQLLLEDKENYLYTMRGRYLNGAISAEDYRHIYKSLKNTDIEDENCVVLCADVDLSYKVLSPSDYEAKRYVLLAELEKRLEEVYEMNTYKTSEDGPIFVIRLGNEKKLQPLRRIVAEVSKELECEVCSAMSNIFYGLEGMQHAYEQALHLFDIAVEAGAGMLTIPEKLQGQKTSQYSVDIENQIISAMRKNDEEQLKDGFVKFVYHLPDSEKQQAVYLHRLLVRLEFWMQNNNEDEDMFVQEFHNLYDMLSKYQMVRLVDVTYRMLQNMIKRRKETVSDTTGQFFGDYIKTAQSYIEEHLHEENLSISQVAGQIYLNPVYFGRVFKSVVGVSFKRYVLNRRIERAKVLILNEDESIAMICEKVGIPNPSYFTKLFKQITGQLPSEYKRNGLNEE